ncbi:MAG: glutamate synthase central domain-containing protein [Dorea sp.]
MEQKEENCHVLKINDPILTDTDLLKIRNMKVDGFRVAEISTTYYKNSSLEKAIDYLFIQVDRAIREGSEYPDSC